MIDRERTFPAKMIDYLEISPEVRAALDEDRPVVALESTVISHGLPYPRNVELARRLEGIIREAGATPATMALAGGKLRVGVDDALLETLGKTADARKVSLRDIGLVLAKGELGATTVAGTMWMARAVGIEVFSTGGIGGVHPGGADVSADLPALATIPICVVSSGAKAILDLPLTHEWLETWGVLLLGFQSEEFPAFYSWGSGLPVDQRVDDATEAARYVRAHLAMERSATLLGVPVPEAEALSTGTVLQWIEEAQRAAEMQGVRGYELTPFLLSDLAERSQGQTLRANLALLENNAAVAARVARRLKEQD